MSEDNLAQTDNQAQTETSSTGNQDLSTGSEASASGWKSSLSSDLASSSLLQKFDDTPEGLNQAFTSHANLEQLLGHEKVPIPKGDDDTEGWNRFSKAMGIPDKAESYGLPDPNIPETMSGITLDKQKFSEIAHAHKLTPAQAKGLWEVYNEMSLNSYNQHLEKSEQQFDETISKLRGEWGDAYDTNVELGQAVINKFASDEESSDYITEVLGRDVRGIKFLTKIGEQFAENKISDFSMKRFSLAPEEAQAEIDKMTRDLEGPYMNVSNKFTQAEHQAAIDRVNHLRASINRARG